MNIVNSCQIGVRTPPVAAVYHFICALKQQIFVIILKLICNLSPDRVIFFKDLCPLFIVSADVKPVFVVVVHIYDNIKVVVICIADDLFDTSHKLIVNFVAVIIIGPTIPRNRYANSVKALLGNLVEHFLSCSRVAPAGFDIVYGVVVTPTLTPAACCLEGVAEIPARLEILDKINSVERKFRLLCHNSKANHYARQHKRNAD